jgi:hypothetical protein
MCLNTHMRKIYLGNYLIFATNLATNTSGMNRKYPSLTSCSLKTQYHAISRHSRHVKSQVLFKINSLYKEG